MNLETGHISNYAFTINNVIAIICFELIQEKQNYVNRERKEMKPIYDKYRKLDGNPTITTVWMKKNMKNGFVLKMLNKFMQRKVKFQLHNLNKAKVQKLTDSVYCLMIKLWVKSTKVMHYFQFRHTLVYGLLSS